MTATHVMTMLGLAQRDGREQLPAPVFAYSVGTNDVVIRRVVAQLRDAGLVEVSRGAAGGVRLARTLEEISLADVAEATETEAGLARYAPGCPSGDCSVAPHIADAVRSRAAEAEAALRDQLATVTLASLVADIHQRIEVPA